MPVTFQFFAYDECIDKEVLTAAMGGIAPIGTPIPAVLEGFVLRFSAVSISSPRLGLPNVLPVSDATVDAEDEGPRAVFGVVYTLPTAVRAALLQYMANKGSYNVFTHRMRVRPLSDAARSALVSATIVAALDLHWLTVMKAVSESFTQMWTELPSPSPFLFDPLLSSTVSDDAAVLQGKGGAKRWPGYHWCNCIATLRTAPTPETLGALQRAVSTGITAKVSALSDGATISMLSSYEAALLKVATRAVDNDKGETRTWYLAYGSNMSWEQLCVRIGPPYQRRAARLPGYVLIANKVPADPQSTFGYYNVEPLAERQRKASQGLTKGPDPMPGHVCGAAYEISMAQLALMDGYEWGYTREWLDCEDISEKLGLRGGDTGEAFQRRDGTKGRAGALTAAWTYIATDTSEQLLPSAEYLSRVLEGEDAIPPEYALAIRQTPTHVLRSPRQEKRIRKEL